MSWLVDHANVIFIVLGLAVVACAVAWWMNQRIKLLGYAAIAGVVLIVLLWLLTRTIVTDRDQIRHNVDAMANAVASKDAPAVFKHFARDFGYKDMTRVQMTALLQGTVERWAITEVKPWEFEIVALSRPDGKAKARFKTSVFDKDGVLAVVLCIADFVLEDEQWKLRAIEFRDARHPDQPMPGAP